jgi:hypothetical protein
MGANTSQFLRGTKEWEGITTDELMERQNIKEMNEETRAHFLKRVREKIVPFPKLFSTKKDGSPLRSDYNFYLNVSFDKFDEKYQPNPYRSGFEDYFLHEIQDFFQNYLDSYDDRFASTRVSMLLHS